VSLTAFSQINLELIYLISLDEGLTDMAIYYHHVGKEGADLDFTKTIFTKVNLSDIFRYTPPQNLIFKEKIHKPLIKACLDKTVHCWGVPSGAYYKINNLLIDDYVILIGHLDNPFLILSSVLSYHHQKLPQLSNFLWGTPKYPYIFFINSDWDFLNIPWEQLCRMLKYDLDYNPRGLFLNIASDAIRQYGGTAKFISDLKKFTIKK